MVTATATAADVLYLALRRRGLTQEQLARHTSHSQKHVSQVLTGKARMSPRFAAYAEIYLAEPGLSEELLVAQARIDAAEALTHHPTSPEES